MIQALNADMPFDQFTIEQLAGDMLANPTQSQVIATGFHRNTMINEEGGSDPEQFRVEAVVDRVNTTGSVWLGLTVGCAQCHTHKYDPISQREYFQLFAFFNNADEPTLALPTPEQKEQQAQVKADLAVAQKELAELDKTLTEEARKTDPKRLQLQSRVTELQKRDRELKQAIPSTMVISERSTPRETYVHLRGDFLRKGPAVAPGVLEVMPALTTHAAKPTRLDFARWLVDRKNPLTPRVTVNRVWQRYFGNGLVETENDFGKQGAAPTHPALLDWLAATFAAPALANGPDCGWSLKRLHRLIVTSATYRQSSHARPDLAEIDPANRLLARQSRLRLDAEIVRDVALTASGLLSRKIGGPSVFPPQPAGIDAFTQSKKNWVPSQGEDRYRRGMYTFLWRTSPHPLLTTFDAPNAAVSCTRRNRSNTPLGALMLANDLAHFEMAQALAARVLTEVSASDEARLRYAFRRCLARESAANERLRLLAYLDAQKAAYARDLKNAATIAPRERPQGIEVADAAAWTAVSRVLLNLDEFITRE